MRKLTRREALRAAGLLGLAGVLPAGAARSLSTHTGAHALKCALHVHSSFSEGTGSMQAQLASAAAAGFDVLWFTDHDWRLSQYGYRQVVHFDGMSEAEDGLSNSWQHSAVGSLVAAGGAIVTSPVSPLDPSGGKAMHVTATSSPTQSAFSFSRYRMVDSGARQNLTGTLNGTGLQIEVFPQQLGNDGFAELLVRTSFRPALAGRPAGHYEISYRLGGPGAPGSAVLAGTGTRSLTGVVTLAVEADVWNSVRVDPASDMARLWPDLVAPNDIGLIEMAIGVATRAGATTSATFDYLRISRRTTGAAAMDAQRSLSSALAAGYPDLVQHLGLEVSLTDAHVNWFGGKVSPFDFRGQPVLPADRSSRRITTNIQQIHAAGGLASYNHMFSTAPAGGAIDQDDRRAWVARLLLDSRAFGADMLEIYRLNSGVDIAHHLQAWDVCSRNGLFLTGSGVSDNHSGQGWTTEINRFATWAYGDSTAETDLLGAFSAGRTYFGDLVSFGNGSLDLLVDDAAPMGSVSRSTEATRQVTVRARGIPADGAVRLVQGVVDYANTTEPKTLVSEILPTGRFTADSAAVPVSNAVSSFVRVEVLDAHQSIIAASNPAWLVREEPPYGIPPARRVT